MTKLSDLADSLSPQERIAAGLEMLREGKTCAEVNAALGKGKTYWGAIRDQAGLTPLSRHRHGLSKEDTDARLTLLARFGAGESLDALERDGLPVWYLLSLNTPPSHSTSDNYRAVHEAAREALKARRRWLQAQANGAADD